MSDGSETTTETTEGTENSSVFDYSDYDFSFVKDKYSSEDRSPVEAAFEQAKAYGELEKRFGSFTGAPESYELNYSDDLKAMVEEKGVSLLEADNPRIEALFEFAKEQNMSQEGLNKFLELEVMDQIAQQEAYAEFAKEEIEKLGREGQQRIDAIGKWAEANLGDKADDLLSMATDAAQFAALEAVINMTKNAPVVDTTAPAAPTLTRAEVEAMQFEMDEFGNRKMAVDPDHRRKVDEAWKRLSAQG